MNFHEAFKKPLYLALNILSSVLIVFMNRYLMSTFKFVSLLSGLHLLASGAFVRVLQMGSHKKSPDTRLDIETMLLIFWTVSSLESLNLSLMLNTVSFYQVRSLVRPVCVWLLWQAATWMDAGNKALDHSLLCNCRIFFRGQCSITMADDFCVSNSLRSRISVSYIFVFWFSHPIVVLVIFKRNNTCAERLTIWLLK